MELITFEEYAVNMLLKLNSLYEILCCSINALYIFVRDNICGFYICILVFSRRREYVQVLYIGFGFNQAFH